MSINEEQIKKNQETVMALIDKYIVSERKQKIVEMLNDIGEQYFTAPASSKKSHHSAFTGGLVHHTLAMTKSLFKIAEAMDSTGFPTAEEKESLLIVGLFHDLGKAVTTKKEDIYVLNSSEWHRDKLGKIYEYNPDIRDGLTHAQRSIRLLTHYCIVLSDDEFQAILFHDGQYVDENISVKNKESKLLVLLSFADYWTTFITGV